MVRIKYLLRKPNSPGFIKAIYATVRYRNLSICMYLGISIHTDAWYRKKGINKPKEIPENYELIDKLSDYSKLIRETYKELQEKTPKSVVPPQLLKKAVYAKHLGEQVERATAPAKDNCVLIVDFFQTMIDDSRNEKRKSQESKVLTKATITTYETTKKHFISFQEKNRRKYSLSDIDQKLIDNLLDYFSIHLNMSANGAGKHMKNIRTLLNYARQKKLITADVLLDNKVKVTHESPDNIYLNRKDITDLKAIKEFDSPQQEVAKDLLVIGCLTGLRYSDYSNLSKARIEDGFIHITQQKTKGRVVIPIHPDVRGILAKYPNGIQPMSNQKFNEHLKAIGKKLPQLHANFEKVITKGGKSTPMTFKKYELLSSHSARRSFATNEYLSGTPVITIMKITGHKSEKAFLLYIKADMLQHAMLLAERWKKSWDSDGYEQLGTTV